MKCVLGASTFLLAVLLPSLSWTAPIDEPNQRTPATTRLSSASRPRILTHVDLKQSAKEAIVRMTGNGQLSYRVRPVGTERLIVDLFNTSTNLPHAFEFHDATVRQIRVGQHPNVLRLVIDLRRSAAYSVQEGKNTLSIVLTSRADLPVVSPAAL